MHGLVIVVIIGILTVFANGTEETSDNVESKERSDDIPPELNRNTEINDNFELTILERTGEKVTADSILSGVETLKTNVISKRIARQTTEASAAITDQDKVSLEERKPNDYSERLDDDSSMFDDSFEIDDNVESRDEYNEERASKFLQKDQSEIEEYKYENSENNDERQSLDSKDIVAPNEDELKSSNDETKSGEKTKDWDDLDDLDDILITRRMFSPPDTNVFETKVIVDEKNADQPVQSEEITIPPRMNVLRSNKCCKKNKISPDHQSKVQYPIIRNPLRIFPNVAPGPPRFFYPNIIQPNVHYIDRFTPTINTRPYNYNQFALSNYYQPRNQIFPEIPHYEKKNSVDIPGFPYKALLSPNTPRYNSPEYNVLMKLEKATAETERKHEPLQLSYLANFPENAIKTYTPKQIINLKYF